MDVQKKLDDLHYDVYALYRLKRKSDLPLLRRYWAEIDKLEDLLTNIHKESAK